MLSRYLEEGGGYLGNSQENTILGDTWVNNHAIFSHLRELSYI